MDIVIIGAGPAGMVTAINAKNKFNNVILIEKNDRIGKKLLATGNGRCNYTNLELSRKNYNNTNFVKDTLKDFSNEDLINYFKVLGLESTTDGKRVYPKTLKANTVLSVLMYWLSKKEIDIRTNTEVKLVEKNKNTFTVVTDKESIKADIVIFSAGAKSMPSSGSDGRSFKILENLGVKITDLKPALTQIKLDSKYLKHLSGTKVIGNVKFYKEDKKIDERSGEILFTNYGISGPPILDLSVNVTENNFIEVPIINNVDENTKEMLYSRYYMFPDFSLEEFLIGIVDKKFVHYIIDSLDLDKKIAMNMISILEFEKIVDLLLKSRFKVTGTNGFKNSQVTRGGVELSQINSFDYSVKKIDGLYVIGEALDIDGDCGGYNLHFAIACGYRLGKILSNKNNLQYR
ncbi:MULTISPECIES: aminoacetone oxidase family FAD-binding enzyme [Peptoniphilus]|jgi:flavoprotein family protein|uniref:aminoacetone oxidase family FAD-binding enzyme n=1 Tax=Peptoniphilus TaxID=162289 RepID=UPI0025906258|nr:MULTISPECIES: aminoacetone oxidase family FAD-binding enzyme [Peptoniphilus]MDU1044024.1 aminoacetone oxidase family FAD-binding enzyme [Peptoniphilus rhinitidis]MDU5594870.1 aminoacetone oxidase family FAD-binding enzyme [Peptoniphilus rhinitidis]MDU7302768.1 aminoacetone oxidase family FAD-binding enzyme [Peptoniphilus lacydonensis]